MTENQKLADEHLRQYQESRRDLQRLHLEIEQLEAKCNRTSKAPDSIMWDTGRKDKQGRPIRVPMDIQASHYGNGQEELLAALADRRDYYWQQCAAAERLCMDIAKSIAKLCPGVEGQVLSMYYCATMRIEQIAVIINFSYPHVKRIRWRALERYGSKLKDDPL